MLLNWFKGMIFKDRQIKLVCLLFSIMLWLFVRSTTISTIKINVPLKITGLPENLAYFKEPPEFTKIHIQGKKESLKFSTSGLKAFINLKNAKPGRRSYEVNFDKRQLPPHTKLLSVLKEEIILERQLEKQLLVKVNLKGEVLSGYKVGKVSVSPSKLKFKGPLSRMSKLYQVYTKPINISAKSKGMERTIEVEKLHSSMKNLGSNQVRVQIKISRAEMQDERTLNNIKINILNSGDSLHPVGRRQFEIEPKSVQVIVQGPKEILKFVQDEDISIFVDLTDSNLAWEELSSTNDNNENKEPHFYIPLEFKMLRYTREITISKVTPPQVMVHLKEKSPQKEKQSGEQKTKDDEPSPPPNL